MVLATGAALAQQPIDVLAPVVITATREEARGFDLPASIDSIGVDEIQKGQLGVNLSESLGRVPGIVVQNRQNYAQDLQISSRGFGARSTFGVRGIRLFADGIPATMPDGQGQVSHFSLGSAKRIEVLRGPFSALYGNSSGGVVQILTEDGSPEPNLTPSVAFGSFGTSRIGLKLTGVAPGSRPDYVLEASRFETTGYRDHSAATRESGNAKLKFALSEATTVSLIGNTVNMPDAQDPLGLTRAQFDADPRQVDSSAITFNTRKSVRQTQGGVVLDHRLSESNSVRVMGYLGKRDVGQILAIPVATQTPATHSGGVVDLSREYTGLDVRWTHRNRLLDGPLTVSAGLNYDALNEQRKGYNNFVGASLGIQGILRRDEDNRVTNFDQYVQGEWRFARDWQVTAGVRASRVKFRSEDNFIVGVNGDDSGSATYSAVTPVGGLVYHLTDTVNLYGSVGKGFETPTFNELAYRPPGSTGAGLNFDLRPAKSVSYEIGAKMLWGAGSQLNIAAYRTRTTDEIVVLTNSGGRSTFQNAGHTSRDGFEAGFVTAFTRSISLAMSAATVRATYDDTFVTCPVAPCAAPNVTIPAGSKIPGVPEHTGFAELAFRQPGLTTAFEVRAMSRVFVNDQNSDQASGYAIAGWRLVLEQKRERWTFAEFLRIENLFDRKYSGSMIVNEGNSRFFEPAPGRSYLVGASAQYRF
ncbi:MAG: TonB-dependent receptor family protein [Burkholderiales bacterium]